MITAKSVVRKIIIMSTHDLLMLVMLLTPGILLSVVIMVTFAAGG
jgi:hypothetical protein